MRLRLLLAILLLAVIATTATAAPVQPVITNIWTQTAQSSGSIGLQYLHVSIPGTPVPETINDPNTVAQCMLTVQAPAGHSLQAIEGGRTTGNVAVLTATYQPPPFGILAGELPSGDEGTPVFVTILSNIVPMTTKLFDAAHPAPVPENGVLTFHLGEMRQGLDSVWIKISWKKN